MENQSPVDSEQTPTLTGVQSYPGMPQPPAGLTERLQNQKPPRGKAPLIIGIIAVLILVLVGVGGWLYMSGQWTRLFSFPTTDNNTNNLPGPDNNRDDSNNVNAMVPVTDQPAPDNSNLASSSPAIDMSTVDTDKDGLTDNMEVYYGTDPKNPDSDGDGYTDGQEVDNGYNPNGSGKISPYGSSYQAEDIAQFSSDCLSSDGEWQDQLEGEYYCLCPSGMNVHISAWLSASDLSGDKVCRL